MIFGNNMEERDEGYAGLQRQAINNMEERDEGYAGLQRQAINNMEEKDEGYAGLQRQAINNGVSVTQYLCVSSTRFVD